MAISFTPITFKNTIDGGPDLDTNFSRAQAAFTDALSRTSSTNNEMQVDFDMNGNRILNVPTPIVSSDVARLKEVQDAVAGGSASLISFVPYDFITSDTVQGAVQDVADKSNSRYVELTNEDALHVIYANSKGELPNDREDGQVALVKGDGQYIWRASSSSWQRDGRVIIPVTFFGALAEAGYNSTSAFQQSADDLGYIAIPLTDVPFEIDSIDTTRETHILALHGRALIKLVTPAVSNDVGIDLIHDYSAVHAGVHIDANSTSRTAVFLRGDYTESYARVDNMTADIDADNTVSGVVVGGNGCRFSIYGENYSNTGKENESFPRLASIAATAGEWHADYIVGRGSQNGGLTADAGVGHVGLVDVENCADNGVYNLSSSVLRIGEVIYRGLEEAVVNLGDISIDSLKVSGLGIAAIGVQDATSTVVERLDISKAAGSGIQTPRQVIRTRSGNSSSGQVIIGSISGRIQGRHFGLLDTGTVGKLVIGAVDLVYEYDSTDTGTISLWFDMQACSEFNISNYKVRIIDVNDAVASGDRFSWRLPTTNLLRFSSLQQPDIELAASDGATRISNGAHVRVHDAAQFRIRVEDANWQTNIGPYLRMKDFNSGIPNSVNNATEMQNRGFWHENADYNISGATAAPFRVRVTTGGDPATVTSY